MASVTAGETAEPVCETAEPGRWFKLVALCFYWHEER